MKYLEGTELVSHEIPKYIYDCTRKFSVEDEYLMAEVSSK